MQTQIRTHASECKYASLWPCVSLCVCGPAGCVVCVLVCVYECIKECKCLIDVRVCLYSYLCVCVVFRCLTVGAGRELIKTTPICQGEAGRGTAL